MEAYHGHGWRVEGSNIEAKIANHSLATTTTPLLNQLYHVNKINQIESSQLDQIKFGDLIN